MKNKFCSRWMGFELSKGCIRGKRHSANLKGFTEKTNNTEAIYTKGQGRSQHGARGGNCPPPVKVIAPPVRKIYLLLCVFFRRLMSIRIGNTYPRICTICTVHVLVNQRTRTWLLKYCTYQHSKYMYVHVI